MIDRIILPRLGSKKVAAIQPRDNAFAKKSREPRAYDGIYFLHYNFVRIHQTLKLTPAMAAGITIKLWELSDMVEVLKEWGPDESPVHCFCHAHYDKLCSRSVSCGRSRGMDLCKLGFGLFE